GRRACLPVCGPRSLGAGSGRGVARRGWGRWAEPGARGPAPSRAAGRRPRACPRAHVPCLRTATRRVDPPIPFTGGRCRGNRRRARGRVVAEPVGRTLERACSRRELRSAAVLGDGAAGRHPRTLAVAQRVVGEGEAEPGAPVVLVAVLDRAAGGLELGPRVLAVGVRRGVVLPCEPPRPEAE